MNSIVLNMAIIYGTVYIQKEIISRSMYYAMYYGMTYIKKRTVEKISSHFNKESAQNIIV